MITLKNILVGTDFSPASDEARRYGRELARLQDAHLHMLHVVEDVSDRLMTLNGPMADTGQILADLEADARQRLDAAARTDDRTTLCLTNVVLVSPTPAQTITAYARQANIDLVIVGTHGRTGLAYFFLGSVAQHVVRTAPCPVLTVRQPHHQVTADTTVPSADGAAG